MENLLLGFGILLWIQIMGEVLAAGLHLPLPGTLIGMPMLALFLLTGIISPSKVKDTSQLLLGHMPLFFIPLTVGIIGVWHTIREQLPALSLLVVASTLIVLVVTGHTTQYLIRRQEKHSLRKGR